MKQREINSVSDRFYSNHWREQNYGRLLCREGEFYSSLGVSDGLSAGEFGERRSVRVETDVVLVVHHLLDETERVGTELLVETGARLLEDGEIVVFGDAEEIDDEEGDEKKTDREDHSHDDGAEVIEHLEFLLTHSAE
ncbi:hypothetical protein PFISCL1PPCAC_23741, partial [Pristionchus fissidentatus]